MAAIQHSVMASPQQFFARALKSLELTYSNPTYSACDTFVKPEASTRIAQYSADGRLYAFALPASVRVLNAENPGEVIRDIELPGVVEIGFSPKGTFISTWERPAKLEDGALHKNLRVWSIETGEEIIAFHQKGQEGWNLQYTQSESHAIRLAGPEIQVFHPSAWTQGNKDAVEKLRVEGMSNVFLSPGANPSLALFIPEKNGSPANIRIHNLQTLAASPTCSKSFFKADKVQVKWNATGTLMLLMTQTEVDKTNKSYYGETGLFLLSAAGNFDSRIVLDKDGPIHDFAWNPNSKEFGIVYGYTPAKTTLFDQRVKPVHEFGSNPHNFISWNPQGRLVALAGFGNLAGKIDVFDRKTLNKVTTIDAPHTSFFEWSPDGASILTATLSPRLRVDNGIKIWHCSGKLLEDVKHDELFQVGWRPLPPNRVPPFPPSIPPAPAPSPRGRTEAPAAVKPAGAYRPPGALGRAAPSIFKREDEGGPSSRPSTAGGAGGGPSMRNGFSESNSFGGPGSHGGHTSRGRGGAPGGIQAQRYVPGAPPPRNTQQHMSHNDQGEGGEKASRKKNKGKKKAADKPQHSGQEQEQGSDHEVPVSVGRLSLDANRHPRSRPGTATGFRQGHPNGPTRNPSGSSVIIPPPKPTANNPAGSGGVLRIPIPQTNGEAVSPAPPSSTVDELLSPVEGGLDPTQKKIRNLNKKLKAIEELKEKLKRGEKLEVTQLRKIETEAEIRKELVGMMAFTL